MPANFTLRRIEFLFLLLVGAICPLVATLSAAEPQWIWSQKEAASKAAAETLSFRKAVSLEQPEAGSVEITADNTFELFVNGRRIGKGDNWNLRYKFDISPLLVPGRNIIAVQASNAGPDPAGMAAKITVKSKGTPEQVVVTDASWKFSPRPSGPWTRLEMDDSQWPAAVALGEYGKLPPWGPAGKLVEGEKALVLNSAKARQRGHFEFEPNDRVVFLGATFIERLQSTGYLEALLTTHLHHKNLTFRNLGWSGDTVWGDARAVFGSRPDGFKRLITDVAETKPTVLVICYGENEAYAGEAGIETFRDGLGQLLDALEPTGARILLVGPRQHENLGKSYPNPAAYNATLKTYIDVIQQTAQEREHAFISLFDAAAPNSVGSGVKKLTTNGRHLTPAGDAVISREFCKRLGISTEANSIRLAVQQNTLDVSGALVTNVALTADKVTLTALVPASSGTKITIAGLPEGKYLLQVGGGEATPTTAQQLAVGVWAGSALEPSPAVLLQTIATKNELYFHRYRPQNETYLFLFRKHEQGNNAVEIPMFDPLIAAQEAEIAKFAKPSLQQIEIHKAP